MADAQKGLMTEGEMDKEFIKAGVFLAGCPTREVRLSPVAGEDSVVEVGFNGRMFLLKRGENLKLPEPLCEILEHAGLL